MLQSQNVAMEVLWDSKAQLLKSQIMQPNKWVNLGSTLYSNVILELSLTFLNPSFFICKISIIKDYWLYRWVVMKCVNKCPQSELQNEEKIYSSEQFANQENTLSAKTKQMRDCL